MSRESVFQAGLIRELKSCFDGCYVLKNDANYIQGFPDLLVLYKERWAALECKASRTAHCQPNQEWYVQHLDSMGFAAIVYPENVEDVLNALTLHFNQE